MINVSYLLMFTNDVLAQNTHRHRRVTKKVIFFALRISPEAYVYSGFSPHIFRFLFGRKMPSIRFEQST